MKPKTMILMGLAIVCGLGASYMTSRLLADRTPEDKETVEVLVAKRNLSIGERIVKPEDLFEKKTIFKENVNDSPDAIRDLEQLKDKILKQSRNKGDTITPANLYGKNESLDIPEGYGAVGLKVNQETNASGLASLPGSRVDLIWFQRGDKNETSRTDLLLDDVYVLAADGKIDRDGLTAVAQVVTLALTREQTVRVNLAKETGIISFMLRRHGDKEKPNIRGLSGEELRRETHFKHTGMPLEPASGLAKTDEGPPKTEVRATLVVPDTSVKPPMAEPNHQASVPPPAKTIPEAPKTTKQELTIVRNNTVEHIIREVAEDGTIVSETRRVSVLPTPPQQTPPADSKKGPSIET